MDKRLKEQTLAQIKDPKVREHYRAKFEMEEEIEAEGGLRTGGIFDVAGVKESAYVTTSEVVGAEESGYVTSPNRADDETEVRGLELCPGACCRRGGVRGGRAHVVATMSAEPVIVCEVELPPIPSALLRDLGQKELKKDDLFRTVSFLLCPVCLFPKWVRTEMRGENRTIRAELDAVNPLRGLCVKCEKIAHEHPALFEWVGYILRMRGVL